MSTTPYLKLALGQYVDSTTTQTNTLTYAIGAVGSTINEAISTIPGTQVVAGVNGSVPETTKGQHNAFTDPAASAIQTAVTNNEVGVPLDMRFKAVENIVFGYNTNVGGNKYSGKIDIWNSTSSPYTLWGSFETGDRISETFTIIIENLDGGLPPIISVYRNSDFTKQDSIGWSGGTSPSGSLPLSFVIELESPTANLDYLATHVVDNCLSGDTLVEKMVEVEVDEENV